MSIQFNRYKTLYATYKESTKRGRWDKSTVCDRREFYVELSRRNVNRTDVRAMHELADFSTSHSEDAWYRNDRLYYNVWPGILEALMRVSLDLPARNLADLAQRIHSSLCLRLPVNHGVPELTHSERGEVTAVLFCLVTASQKRNVRDRSVRSTESPRGDRVASLERLLDLDHSTLTVSYQFSGGTFCCGSIAGPADIEATDLTVQRVFIDQDSGLAERGVVQYHETAGVDPDPVGEGPPLFAQVLRLVLAVSLLSQDAELIQPDVLADDRDKLGASADQDKRLQDRAASRRGGERGWDVGRTIYERRDVSPHYRNPHLCHFHVGEGRRQTVLKLRSGSLVKRAKVQSVPSGYEDRESVPDEIDAILIRQGDQT